MVDQHLVDVIKKLQAESKQRKFLESVELAINLKDIDLTNPKNRLQEEIILPNGRGKPIRIGVFGSSEMAVKAKGLADLIIQPEEIEALASDKAKARKFARGGDFFLAEAPLMPTIGKRLGVVLGPRGKMPKPIPPGSDPKAAIEKLRSSVTVRTRDKKTFHLAIGTKDMSPEKLAENLDAVLKRLMTKLERGKNNIQSAYVKTTMGPSYKVM
ncbi:MAG: 50S ribosomal protein L1 [Thermoplasmatota archaeon]|nr:50S ribosomal protein L1 [Candidatus Thermoplasmatota archaeon]MBU1913808.1 50S ribosomal protein L1 [Candidatus Thermoplasmatota archaeon]